jgi:hypothetical protein
MVSQREVRRASETPPHHSPAATMVGGYCSSRQIFSPPFQFLGRCRRVGICEQAALVSAVDTEVTSEVVFRVRK